MCVHAQSCPTLCDPVEWICQAPLSMEFSRQEYWNRLAFPTQGDLPDPGIEFASLAATTLVGRFVTFALPGRPQKYR